VTDCSTACDTVRVCVCVCDSVGDAAAAGRAGI